MKLTLRVSRLLAVCTVIGDFFMVAPAMTRDNIRSHSIRTSTSSFKSTFEV